jgi:hypothetical protein
MEKRDRSWVQCAQTVSHAHEVDARIVRAASLLEIRMRLADETFASVSLATGRRFGLTTKQISALFKIDLSARERHARRQVDGLIDQFADPGPLDASFHDLQDTLRLAAIAQSAA